MNQPPIERGATGAGPVPPQSRVLCSGLFGAPARPGRDRPARAVGSPVRSV